MTSYKNSKKNSKKICVAASFSKLSFFVILVSMSHVRLVTSFLRCNSATRRFAVQSTPSPQTSLMVRWMGDGAPNGSSSARNRRKERKGLAQDDAVSTESSSSSSSSLEWETFDFSDSPKWDTRFDENAMTSLHLPSNVEDYEKIQERETQEDLALQARFEQQHNAWKALDPSLVQAATNVLIPFVKPERWERIQGIYQQRTQQTRFLFENPANPSNVWACLRTLDSFGIQHVDVVIQSGQFQGKAALVQKRGMRTAMGSAKWLTVKNHLTTRQALDQMKREGYRILCTDVNPSSKDIREMDWDAVVTTAETTTEAESDKDSIPPPRLGAAAPQQKLCIVMGNELKGISEEVKEYADASFYLPMAGFAESFNLSVATAITCAHLSAASRNGHGPLRPGDLDPDEYHTLLLRGVLNSIEHRTAKALLKAQGVLLPKDLPL
jgi:tRNA (guanosine-2'-O-)-methyltransferase